MAHAHADITLLLRAASSGDRRDLDALMVAVYDDMRRLAVSHMRAESSDHTLQPTALVHEAYVKLIDQRSTGWRDRLHFFAIAAQIIRRILIDHARERDALKRGGNVPRVPLDGHDLSSTEASPTRHIDLLALDQALRELDQLDPRQARIVELRFFAGCSLDEIAQILDVARRTIDRDWCVARAWLYDRLSGAAEDARDG